MILLLTLLSCDDTQKTPAYSTIYHQATGLTWIRCSIDTKGDVDDTFMCTKPHAELFWKEAINTCENLEFAGHNDWRLPNIRELQSIVNYYYPKNLPAVDTLNFPGTHSANYWSSTTYPGKDGDSSYAWVVDFTAGNPWASEKQGFLTGGMIFTRCVRGPDK